MNPRNIFYRGGGPRTRSAILPRVFFIFSDPPPPCRVLSPQGRGKAKTLIDTRRPHRSLESRGSIYLALSRSRVSTVAREPDVASWGASKRRLNYHPLLFILWRSADDAPVPRPGHLVHARHPLTGVLACGAGPDSPTSAGRDDVRTSFRALPGAPTFRDG